MSNKLATVFVPIKIKSVEDAKRFLSNFHGVVYIPCKEFDLCIESHGDEVGVSIRRQSERGNILSPYISVYDKAYTLYYHRKYVNAWQKALGSRMY